MSEAAHLTYADAVTLVKRTGNPSPTFIGRELSLKFGDAERLLKRMAKDGVVDGPFSDRPTWRMKVLPE